jgi:hypothetical protein
MRKLALLLALALIPAQAWAFNTDQLLSTIAMPLAVAAVANVAGVPQSQLADLVTTLNQANVPPTQFVQVIRYVPVALVDQNGQPFIAYVKEQTTQGVTGDALVNAIVDRLRTNYNVTPTLDLNAEPTTFVMQDNYIPTVVTTLTPAGTLDGIDPLAVIGLPLAVAAVSNITGVSQTELANLVATLNNANVPPTQVVEVLRYSPVVLVADNGQPFVQYVQQQVSQGVTGPALVPIVVQQLRTYYPVQTQIVMNRPAPQRVFVERDFFPPVVVTRAEEVRLHPHGGPPGQLKKQLGLQTGAEVVHGEKRGRQFRPVPAPAVTNTPVVVAPQARPEKERGRGHGKGEQVRTPSPMISSSPAPAVVPAGPPGKAKGHQEGGPPGQQKDKGNKGGEKGHGKD